MLSYCFKYSLGFAAGFYSMELLLAQDMPPWLSTLLGQLGAAAISVWVLYHVLTFMLPKTEERHTREMEEKDAAHKLERIAWEALLTDQETRHKAERTEWLIALREIKDEFKQEVAAQRLEKHDMRQLVQKMWADGIMLIQEVKHELEQSREVNRHTTNVVRDSAKVTAAAAEKVSPSDSGILKGS